MVCGDLGMLTLTPEALNRDDAVYVRTGKLLAPERSAKSGRAARSQEEKRQWHLES
jgi:hypothetical protein